MSGGRSDAAMGCAAERLLRDESVPSWGRSATGSADAPDHLLPQLHPPALGYLPGLLQVLRLRDPPGALAHAGRGRRAPRRGHARNAKKLLVLSRRASEQDPDRDRRVRALAPRIP